MTLQWIPETAMRGLATGRADSVLPAYQPILDHDAVATYDDGEGGSLGGIFTYREVEKAALDHEAFSSVPVLDGAPRILPLMSDPPRHTADKRLFNSFVRPHRTAALEGRIRPVAIGTLDAMIAAGSADFAADYAYAFPTRSLCELLGLTREWQCYDRWSNEMEVQTRAGMRKPGEGLPQELFQELFQGVVPALAELVSERPPPSGRRSDQPHRDGGARRRAAPR